MESNKSGNSKISNKTNCIDYIKVDNIEYYQPKDISNHLWKYFADIGQKPNKNISGHDNISNILLIKNKSYHN